MLAMLAIQITVVQRMVFRVTRREIPSKLHLLSKTEYHRVYVDIQNTATT